MTQYRISLYHVKDGLVKMYGSTQVPEKGDEIILGKDTVEVLKRRWDAGSNNVLLLVDNVKD
jgi:hypothetical protein